VTKTDFSYMEEVAAANCEAFQAEVFRLVESGSELSGDALLNQAADNLGNADERYCRIYICRACGQMYHQDYSDATEADFCSGECEEETR